MSIYAYPTPWLQDQHCPVVQSASIAALTANSAKASAKNINAALMTIPHHQGVPLHSEYLFHTWFLICR